MHLQSAVQFATGPLAARQKQCILDETLHRSVTLFGLRGPIFSALPEKMGEKRGAWGRGWCMLPMNLGNNQI